MTVSWIPLVKGHDVLIMTGSNDETGHQLGDDLV